MPKATTPTANRGSRRHNPLEDDLLATGILRNKPSKKGSKNDNDEDQDAFVDSKASKNILRIGRELAEEDNAERAGAVAPPTIDNFGYDSRFGDLEDEAKVYGDDDEAWGDDDEEVPGAPTSESVPSPSATTVRSRTPPVPSHGHG